MADRMIPLPIQSPVAAKAPSATIILAEGVPFTPSQRHVRLFSNGKAGCLSYVQSKAVATISQSTPVRWGRLQYRGKYNQDDIKRCNYMAYKNPDDSEWTFAFITNINWLSENSATIEFKLDVFQNDYYNCTWKACYVEREHINKANDNVTECLVPENIETGEFVCYQENTLDFGDNRYFMFLSSDDAGNPPSPTVTRNIFTGLTVYSTNTAADLASELTKYIQNGFGDAVVSIFQAPNMCYTGSTINGTLAMGTAYGTFTPKNFKTLCYPYNYALISGLQGNDSVLMFEYSNDTANGITLNVSAQGHYLPQPAIKVWPKNYKNISNNYLEGFDISSFPQCCWSNDGFQAYIAQNTPIFEYQQKQLMYNFVNKVAGQGANLAGSVTTMNPIDIASNTASAAAGLLTAPMDFQLKADEINAQIQAHDMIPPSFKGTQSTPALNTALNINDLKLYRMGVTDRMARTIDDYFSVFGYSVREVKIPNTTGRTSWNYVKTMNCGLVGSTMQTDLEELRNIFDNGVTLWHTDDIGNYSLSN